MNRRKRTQPASPYRILIGAALGASFILAFLHGLIRNYVFYAHEHVNLPDLEAWALEPEPDRWIQPIEEGWIRDGKWNWTYGGRVFVLPRAKEVDSKGSPGAWMADWWALLRIRRESNLQVTRPGYGNFAGGLSSREAARAARDWLFENQVLDADAEATVVAIGADPEAMARALRRHGPLLAEIRTDNGTGPHLIFGDLDAGDTRLFLALFGRGEFVDDTDHGDGVVLTRFAFVRPEAISGAWALAVPLMTDLSKQDGEWTLTVRDGFGLPQGLRIPEDLALECDGWLRRGEKKSAFILEPHPQPGEIPAASVRADYFSPSSGTLRIRLDERRSVTAD